MKKIILFLFIAISTTGIAQEEKISSFNKNEIKLNLFYSLIGIPEFTYERILNEESSIGSSVLFSIDEKTAVKFALTPYYRFYFGKKSAAGFFVEGFGMINTIKTSDGSSYNYDTYSGIITNYKVIQGKKYTDIALGFSIGSKWITRKGVLFELNGGFGRNLINEDKVNTNKSDFKFVPRFGLNVGYRF